jgi:hypothetical protein
MPFGLLVSHWYKKRQIAGVVETSADIRGSRLLAHAHLVNAGFKNVRANGGRVKAAPLQFSDRIALRKRGTAPRSIDKIVVRTLFIDSIDPIQ